MPSLAKESVIKGCIFPEIHQTLYLKWLYSSLLLMINCFECFFDDVPGFTFLLPAPAELPFFLFHSQLFNFIPLLSYFAV